MCILLSNYITLDFGDKLSYLFYQFQMCYLLPRNKNVPVLHFGLVTFAGHWSSGGNFATLVNCYWCFPPLSLLLWVTVKVIPCILYFTFFLCIIIIYGVI